MPFQVEGEGRRTLIEPSRDFEFAGFRGIEPITGSILGRHELGGCRRAYGGQMQRLMITRILLLKPKILVADEPTSMIDACSHATILYMLMQLRNEIGTTVIFITHDISLVYNVSDSVHNYGAWTIC